MFLLASLGLATGIAAALLLTGLRVARVPSVALMSLVPAAVAWTVGLALMLNGWRDTDGWVDCWRACHGWHWLGALWFFTPPLLAVELVVIAAVGVVRRRAG